MCTVTVFKNQDRLLLTMNRDESRRRPEAGLHLPTHEHKHYAQVYPKASPSGGTWIGCNRSGLLMCLLNRYDDPIKSDAISRGGIIPSVLRCHTFLDAEQQLNTLEHHNYNPFDILLITQKQAKRFTWDSVTFTSTRILIDNGYMLTSSSVDTKNTLKYRQQLFSSWKAHYLQKNDDLPYSVLSLFHLYQEPRLPSCSVLMERENTHTKSITQIEMTEKATTLRYCPEEDLPTIINHGTFTREYLAT